MSLRLAHALDKPPPHPAPRVPAVWLSHESELCSPGSGLSCPRKRLSSQKPDHTLGSGGHLDHRPRTWSQLVELQRALPAQPPAGRAAHGWCPSEHENVPDSPDNGCASRALLGLCETAVHSAGRRGFPRFMSEAEKDEERLLTGRPWQVSYRTTRMGRYVVVRGPLFAKGCRSYARRISDFR